jgi:enamine deaminase RidA (YjgF/YER057c/UK114 family)
MPARTLISSGSPFEQKIGYSRAVVDGRWVFVSGTTGFDYASMTISQDVVEQAEQCFRNLAHALAQAGASLSDVVQARYILPRREDFEPIWPIISKHFADVRPTCTMFVAGLADPRMLIEIEVTALKAAD